MDRNSIDGIGVQGHAFSTRGSAQTMADNVDRLAETGLPIQICEMDVDGPTDETQLNDYQRIFPTFWEHPAVEGITLWGWRPGCWRNAQGAYLVDDRGAERPALEWLRTYIMSPKAPQLASPDNFETNVLRDPILCWHSSDSATTYTVQLSTNTSFTVMVLDSVVADTFLQVPLLDTNKRYFWRVNAANANGASEFSASRIFTTGEQTTTYVNEFAKMPTHCELFQNYPNPFNPVTSIEFTLPEEREMELVVYDILGHVVKQLASGKYRAGYHKVSFDASGLASGVYFYSLTTGDFVSVRKLILAK